MPLANKKLYRKLIIIDDDMITRGDKVDKGVRYRS